MEALKNILVQETAKILDAVKAIDSGGQQIALVVGKYGELLGTITDGDIRRGLLRGVDLSSDVTKVMNRNPHVAKKSNSKTQILALMQKKQISQMPVVDEENRVVSLETISELLIKNKKENFVVLMAGGMGKRLSPMTDSIPKPLLKVGNKPILEIILDNFISHGFHKFFISVNYKAELIKDHFKDGSKYGVDIQYIEEDKFLGTAGPLKLLKEQTSLPLIVMNGDLLTNVSFTNLLEFHKDQNAMATMCVREYDFQVPYGVVCLENDQIKTIDEKPTHKFFVNAGIYVLNPEIKSMIPDQEQFDMPQLFNTLRENNLKTIAFPLIEYWLDIGKKDDFDKANMDFSEVFK